MRSSITAVIAVAAATALLGWNAGRFIDAEQKIRTKDLQFLPSPIVAKLLALGHDNTVAKLRWIDSFAYFELQLERKDDTVTATGESAFERLYRALIELDPQFLPYYEHAMLNLGGVLDRHVVVLNVLQQGLLVRPHETQLWRMLATELRTTFQLEERNPLAMNAILASWYEAERDPQQREQVLDWQQAMGRRTFKGLEQLPYWEEQLRLTVPGTPTCDYVLGTMREQVSRYGVSLLAQLLAAWKKQHGIPPVSIEQLLDPGVVRSLWPQRLPPYAPLVQHASGGYSLLPDAFGYPYELVDGAPVSPGWEIRRATKRAFVFSSVLADIAKKVNHWPSTIEEAVTLGLKLEDLPRRCRWLLEDHQIVLESDPPPGQPWDPLKR